MAMPEACYALVYLAGNRNVILRSKMRPLIVGISIITIMLPLIAGMSTGNCSDRDSGSVCTFAQYSNEDNLRLQVSALNML